MKNEPKVTQLAVTIENMPDFKYFEDFDMNHRVNTTRDVALRAVQNAKLTTNRNNPQPVIVNIASMKIKQGKIEEHHFQSISITPPMAKMNVDEFNVASVNAVKDIPEEIQQTLYKLAWDQGHSSGYEEVINILTNLAEEFDKPLKLLVQNTRQLHVLKYKS